VSDQQRGDTEQSPPPKPFQPPKAKRTQQRPYTAKP
jgi:hypothetical protein